MFKRWFAAVIAAALVSLSAAPPEGVFDWSRTKAVSRDIRHAELTVSDPRPMKIHAVKVDLRNPHLRFVTAGRPGNWGEPMPDYPDLTISTCRQTTLDFVKEMRRKGLNVVLAVNAAPWKPWEKPFTQPYATGIGLAVADHEVVSPPDGRPSLIWKNDGKMEMRIVNAGEELKDIQLAVSGFQFILRDGKTTVDDNPRLEPRTFYGLSRDRHSLYLVTVDGRQKDYSEGMALNEGAQYLKHFGAADAINMDGGGSTSLVIFNPAKGAPELVNLPPGTGLPRASRAVANSLGVYYAGPPTIKPVSGKRAASEPPAPPVQ